MIVLELGKALAQNNYNLIYGKLGTHHCDRFSYSNANCELI